jgi:hypothetical protein
VRYTLGTVPDCGAAPELHLATLVKTDLGKWKAVIRNKEDSF